MRRDYRLAVARAAGGRVGPAAQQGDDRRQSAAAHALPIFLRHQSALQQAPARQRLRRDRRLQPPACGRRRERRVHRHASERHGGRHACARCHGGDGAARTARRASIPIAEFHRLPGDTPHVETTLAARRADHRSHAAEAGRRHAASITRCAIARRMRSRWSRSASIVQTDGTGRVAVGGIAHKPWRVEAAEAETAARREGSR